MKLILFIATASFALIGEIQAGDPVNLDSPQSGDTNGTALTKSYKTLLDKPLVNFTEDETNLRTEKINDRSLKTRLWLQLLNQIDRTRDLNFDFKAPQNRYVLNVAPTMDPSDPRTMRYEAGTDPSSIKEPDIRQMFIAAIQENHRKALRFNFELSLKRLDEDCTTFAVTYIHSAYAKTPADVSDLTSIFAILDDHKHRQEIEARLSDPSK